MLIIILAIAGAIIAIFMFFAYRILAKTIEIRITKSVEETYQRSMAYILFGIGFTCWCSYEVNKQAHHLENAIDYTHRAIQEQAKNLNIKKKLNEEVICMLKNNLAYYIEEGYRSGFDKNVKKILKNKRERNLELALKYSNEINEKKWKFYNHIEEWTDTYEFVQKYCKKNNL